VGYESVKMCKRVFFKPKLNADRSWYYHVICYCVFVSFKKCVVVKYTMIGRCIRTHTSDYRIMMLLCGCSLTLPDRLIFFSESF
jgi:hypothetical protein